MSDRMHPLTAAGFALCVGALGLGVGGVQGLLVAGLLVALGGVALSDHDDAPETCPHCGTRNPGVATCRWCNEDVTATPGDGSTESGA